VSGLARRPFAPYAGPLVSRGAHALRITGPAFPMPPVHAPSALDDPIRLAAVAEAGLLDSDREDAFDDLTRLAATLMDAPFALATVVDSSRAFWKSCFGVPLDGPRESTADDSFCQHVVASGQPMVIGDVREDPRTHDITAIDTMGVRAWAGVPLLAPGGQVLGTFCVVDVVTREWTVEDLEPLRVLGAAAGREIALRAAVRSEHDARTRAEALAETLQEALLPPTLPAVPGLDVAARFHAAGGGGQLVGDFFDVFPVGAGRWSTVIGDVCGKGVEAAKVALLARYAVGVAAIRSPECAEVVRWLNDTLRARGPEPDLFVTAIYGTFTVEPDGCRVLLAGAGHVPPVLRRRDGSIELLDVGGTLAGVFPDVEPGEAEVWLAPGDALVLYTDGVVEARADGTAFGEERLLELVAACDGDAGVLAGAVVAAALEHCGGEASDDTAAVVLRMPV